MSTKTIALSPSVNARVVKASLWSRLWARLARQERPASVSHTERPDVVTPLPTTEPVPQPLSTDSVPVHPVRSVPVPIDALTRLLDLEPAGRARLRHLALLESSCRSSPATPFARLPPRATEIALRQLDALLPRHPALRVLRLQLERHLQGHRARIAALLAAEDHKWHPEVVGPSPGVGLSVDSMIGGPWGVTDFLETVPFEQGQASGATPRGQRTPGLSRESMRLGAALAND